MNKSTIKKIGILGGTFNPIHVGHLILAQNAAEWCNLAKVLIIPSGVSYLKKQSEIASKEHRINMVKASIDSNDLFELSTIETDREGNSYTFETLKLLEEQYQDAKFFYIIGADTLFNIEYWKHPEIIFQKSSIICAKRDSYSDEMYADKIRYLKDKFDAHITLMDIPEVDISSSHIRKLLYDGKSARYYITDGVNRYIKENNLYCR